MLLYLLQEDVPTINLSVGKLRLCITVMLAWANPIASWTRSPCRSMSFGRLFCPLNHPPEANNVSRMAYSGCLCPHRTHLVVFCPLHTNVERALISIRLPCQNMVTPPAFENTLCLRLSFSYNCSETLSLAPQIQNDYSLCQLSHGDYLAPVFTLLRLLPLRLCISHADGFFLRLRTGSRRRPGVVLRGISSRPACALVLVAIQNPYGRHDRHRGQYG